MKSVVGCAVKGKTYDLNKLAASGNFDIDAGPRFFYTTQEYFDALTDFVSHFRQDLGNYTPAFVINSDPDREEFLRECFAVRAKFMSLGITPLLDTLAVMEDAVISRNLKAFSDGQIRLHATLKICRDEIKKSAQRWRLSFGDENT